MRAADPARTNAGPGPPGPGTGATVWVYDLPRGVVPATHAAVAEGRLFVVTFEWEDDRPGLIKPDGILWAFDAATGVPLWRGQVPASQDGPVVSNGLVYTTHMWSSTRDQGGVGAWNATTGKLEWSYTFDWSRAHSPTVAGPLIAVPVSAFNGSAVVALDAATGEFAWEAPLRTQESPAIWRDLLIGASRLGDLAAVEAQTGRVRWSGEIRGAMDVTPVVVGREVGAVLTQFPQEQPAVFAWEPGNGSLRWDYIVHSTESRFALAAAGDGLLLLMDEFGVTALREQDGRQAWTMPATGGFLTGMAVGPTHLFLTQFTPVLLDPDQVEQQLVVQAVDRLDRSLAWERRLGAHGNLAPILADGLLFVADQAAHATRLVAIDAGLLGKEFPSRASPEATKGFPPSAPGFGPVGPAMLVMAVWAHGAARTFGRRNEKTIPATAARCTCIPHPASPASSRPTGAPSHPSPGGGPVGRAGNRPSSRAG